MELINVLVGEWVECLGKERFWLRQLKHWKINVVCFKRLNLRYFKWRLLKVCLDHVLEVLWLRC